ncbi:MAG: type II toxin-antitoxin system PemK/MazF family toxin [Myxococcales bacterium]|nr:MAG: type II toxin-antitoxin system PemK/MazF family toxin [Myxococcales bacterium]
MKRGELWWARLDKRRPVLLLSRDEAYDVRAMVTVAPLSTTIRGFSVEVRVGRKEKLPKVCVVNLDNVATIAMASLEERISVLSTSKMAQVDDSLRFALGLE